MKDKKKVELDRRTFMTVASAGIAGAAAIACQSPSGSAALAGEGEAASGSAAAGGGEYGGYSGNKNFKYIKTPATVYDFGLTPEQEAHAKELHASLIVFDGLLECAFYPELLTNMKLGGCTSGNFSIGITDVFGWTPDTKFEPHQWWAYEGLKQDLERLPGLVETFGDDLMLTLNHADVLEAKRIGKVGFMPGTQNSMFLEGNIARMKEMYDKGLRIVQIVYNSTNAVGSGSMEAVDSRFGLSKYGETVVGTMNDLGMMIDTGHASSETQFKAAEVSEKPIAISHCGMTSKVDQFRSSTDKAIKAVADKGGVMGVISTPSALNGEDRCTVEDFLDNFEHAINIAGIDGVGIGSDFIIPSTFEQILSAPDWDPATVASIGEFEVWPWSDGHVGWENNTAYPNLTRGLIKRGYSDEDIAKLMGGNFMRLIKDTIG